MRITITLLLLLLCVSCSTTPKDSSSTAADSLTTQTNIPSDTASIGDDDLFKIESYFTGPVRDTSRVAVIDYDCAIFVEASDKQVESMKKEYGEDDFYTIADDNSFYDSQAMDSLKFANIRIVSVNKDYLKLIMAMDDVTLNLRKNGSPGWMLIYFNPAKRPEIVSSIDVNMKQIESYFKK